MTHSAWMKAPPHPREAERLATLEMLGILDTDAEPAFDALVELAARLLGTPMALVSLVDRDRQWFKARIGIDAAQTPRDVAFCAHAILGEQRLVVPDAQADPRFADNPLVRDQPQVRFYAGAVIHGPDRLPLGTLCVVDRQPREPDAAALEQLDRLALVCERLIAARWAELQNARRVEEIERYGAALAQAQAQRDQVERYLFHDINSCLTQTGLAAEMLQDGDPSEALRERMTDAVVSGITKATGLVEQLRRSRDSRPSLLPVSTSPTDLAVLVHEVAVAVEPELQRRGLQLHVVLSRAEPVQVDPGLVERVLGNLMRNAVRYSPPGGMVRVCASVERGRWQIAVCDQGPGVPPAERESIFEPRVRVGADAAQPTGEGLGLAFCKLAATAWGGSIRVEDHNGGGARFVIEGPTEALPG